MKTRHLTAAGLLTAAALAVFVLEAQLPPLTAIPGIKPGLSNVFTLFAMELLGLWWALGLLIVRIVLGTLLTGQTMAFFYSLTGGLLAFAVMALLRRPLKNDRLWVRSVFGALGHNAGQLCTAVLLTKVSAVWFYAPVLLAAGIVTGAFTGLCAQMVLARRKRRN